jgi:pullulanase
MYNGDDLGANYKKEYTLFKVWSPFADKIKVVIYNIYNDIVGNEHNMIKKENGVWELILKGDYKNKYYNYKVTINSIERETPDPYTKSATINGKKGMIVDFNDLNPEGWENHSIPSYLKYTESIIYEMHVRDFSIDKNSGIKNKGKYLAFTEEKTKGINKVSTGINHLKELGITHIHLLPVFDFQSVDESKEGEYNWGYDPYLYCVPEGSYSTNPYDGRIRIIEFKKMIKSLHENNIRVVMDMVLNHTYKTGNSPFDIIAPKYYYRTYENGTYSNGSGCGNEIASEKPMVRKFIIDCLKFWATEYKIDGFRFDLMGLHDIETMKEVEKELRKINPNILLYGEPWTGGISSLDYKLQFRKGCQRGTGIAVFNDGFRNAVKGDNDGTGLGFINGGYDLENKIKKGITGSIYYNDVLKGFANEPGESINYVSSHDNLTLFDKVEKSNPESTKEEIEKMNKLALSIILTSQGVPFIHGGSEILRSKNGHNNSYNLGDEINKINWYRKNRYIRTFEYIKGLIHFRKSQKVMMLDKSEEIKKNLRFIETPPKAIAYILNSTYEKDYKYIFIVHNANKKEVIVQLPKKGPWKLVVNEFEVNLYGPWIEIKENIKQLKIPPLCTYILCKN